MFEARKQEVLAKVNELQGLIEKTWGFRIPNLTIRFDLKGCSAGQAGRRDDQYFMRVNATLMMNEGWDHIINNTVPHEMAHLACYVRPMLGRNHDSGWQRVCLALGGNGKRCHSEAAEPSRKVRRYAYIASCGTVVTLTQVRHNKILRGASFRLRNTGGRLDRTCSYRQVA